MSQDYVQEKARQALQATDGDSGAARQLLVAWAVRDQSLLLGLAKAHLKSLAQIALEQAEKETASDSPPKKDISPEIFAQLINQARDRRKNKTVSYCENEVNHLDPVRQAKTWQTIVSSLRKIQSNYLSNIVIFAIKVWQKRA